MFAMNLTVHINCIILALLCWWQTDANSPLHRHFRSPSSIDYSAIFYPPSSNGNKISSYVPLNSFTIGSFSNNTVPKSKLAMILENAMTKTPSINESRVNVVKEASSDNFEQVSSFNTTTDASLYDLNEMDSTDFKENTQTFILSSNASAGSHDGKLYGNKNSTKIRQDFSQSNHGSHLIESSEFIDNFAVIDDLIDQLESLTKTTEVPYEEYDSIITEKYTTEQAVTETYEVTTVDTRDSTILSQIYNKMKQNIFASNNRQHLLNSVSQKESSDSSNNSTNAIEKFNDKIYADYTKTHVLQGTRKAIKDMSEDEGKNSFPFNRQKLSPQISQQYNTELLPQISNSTFNETTIYVSNNSPTLNTTDIPKYFETILSEQIGASNLNTHTLNEDTNGKLHNNIKYSFYSNNDNSMYYNNLNADPLARIYSEYNSTEGNQSSIKDGIPKQQLNISYPKNEVMESDIIWLFTTKKRNNSYIFTTPTPVKEKVKSEEINRETVSPLVIKENITLNMDSDSPLLQPYININSAEYNNTPEVGNISTAIPLVQVNIWNYLKGSLHLTQTKVFPAPQSDNFEDKLASMDSLPLSLTPQTHFIKLQTINESRNAVNIPHNIFEFINSQNNEDNNSNLSYSSTEMYTDVPFPSLDDLGKIKYESSNVNGVSSQESPSNINLNFHQQNNQINPQWLNNNQQNNQLTINNVFQNVTQDIHSYNLHKLLNELDSNDKGSSSILSFVNSTPKPTPPSPPSPQTTSQNANLAMNLPEIDEQELLQLIMKYIERVRFLSSLLDGFDLTDPVIAGVVETLALHSLFAQIPGPSDDAHHSFSHAQDVLTVLASVTALTNNHQQQEHLSPSTSPPIPPWPSENFQSFPDTPFVDIGLVDFNNYNYDENKDENDDIYVAAQDVGNNMKRFVNSLVPEKTSVRGCLNSTPCLAAVAAGLAVTATSAFALPLIGRRRSINLGQEHDIIKNYKLALKAINSLKLKLNSK